MSSATPNRPGEGGALVTKNKLPEMGDAGTTGQLSPRQLRLKYYWSYYNCDNYNGYAKSAYGHDVVGPVQREEVVRGDAIPPGYCGAGQGQASMKPAVDMVKPVAGYYLGRVIVNRFTSLIFSKKRHPKLGCDDANTEDWIKGWCDAVDLWSRMVKARNYGGAMGSVGVSFKFIEGQPRLEVHDPKWAMPTDYNRETGEVGKFEIRYKYVLEVRNRKGELEPTYFWYRRIIDAQHDVVWPKVAVTDEEPEWEEEKNNAVEHGFGFCPVVWVQNKEVDDDIDGIPDCYGIYDKIEAIDVLDSRAHCATIANTDPTPVVSSDLDFEEIVMGSKQAIQVEKGGSVAFAEIRGTAIQAATTLADRFEDQALTVSRCQLDKDKGGAPKTATEVEHQYSSMIEEADILRSQYGKSLQRLVKMVLGAARFLAEPHDEPQSDGTVKRVSYTIALPKKSTKNPDTGAVTYSDRELGDGEQVYLRWPDYFEPTQTDVQALVTAAGQALKVFGLIDQETAVRYVSTPFQIENVPDMVKKIKADIKTPGVGFDPLTAAPPAPGSPPAKPISIASKPLPFARAK